MSETAQVELNRGRVYASAQFPFMFPSAAVGTPVSGAAGAAHAAAAATEVLSCAPRAS